MRSMVERSWSESGDKAPPPPSAAPLPANAGEDKKRAARFRAALRLSFSSEAYLRSPMNISRNWNMLMKSRYSWSAPMMTVLPAISVPATWKYRLLIRCVS